MSKDPYRYFRVEARELLEGMTRGVIELEKGPATPEVLARLLRLAHTLKGAARVVRQPAIAEAAHAVEGLLADAGDPARPLPAPVASELLGLFDRVTALLDGLDPAPAAPPTAPPSPASPTDPRADAPTTAAPRPDAEPAPETVRADLRELDLLLRGVTEGAVLLGGVRRELEAAERLRLRTRALVEQLTLRPGDDLAAQAAGAARARILADEAGTELDRLTGALATGIERVEGALGEVSEVAQRLRLVAAHTLFPLLDRAVRDAALTLGRTVEFEATGGEVRLDAHVLGSLRDALMHVVRNAVTHGLEPEAERLAAGKPPRGTVRLTITRRGGRVDFVCSDDGRGVDVEAVKRVAIARGRLTPARAAELTPEAVVALLCAGGITTSGHVTELSGRGIGLDVVRAATLRLKGALAIHSESGRGATIEVQVPVSVVSLSVLLLESSGRVCALPLDAVRQVLRIDSEALVRAPTGTSVVEGGEVLPFLPLDALLERGAPRARRARWRSVVLVEAAGRRIALGVDRLLGTADVVMRPLPELVEAEAFVSGACLDAEGTPQLVLDPAGLVARAAEGVAPGSEPHAPERPPVLVVDDSLTTRMLEQSILESAGYRVELAVSAEEGLLKARERRFSLFVVDVEMPGMDGFGFVRETRGDPGLRDIPAILVTSRNAPEDRRRGEQAGAAAYIVKGEFDQDHLLETIRHLIG